MRQILFLTFATIGLLLIGGPAASEDKPGVKNDKQFEGDEGKVREAKVRNLSQNNLKQIGLAMHNYHDKHGAFPPAATHDKKGTALLSWRVAILPFIAEEKLYDEFKLDEPWDSAHNKKLLAKMPKVFACPAGKAKANHTFYQVFVGKGAAFEGKTGIKIPDFTDGTSNTILAIEGGADVPWTKPVDLEYKPGKKLPVVGGILPTTFNILMADGSVRQVTKKIKPKTLEATITRNGGEAIEND